MAEEGLKKRMPDTPVEPVKIFDDVYYIGRRMVGVFAVTTSEGIVLIDSMDPVDAGERFIVPGMEKMGLDPADIKLVILTHGHYDHILGARNLQKQYGCRVCLGETDSAFMVMTDVIRGSMNDMVYPHIDFYLEDGKEITVGDHRFMPILTPGHTPGCMSLIFNCHDNGREHWVSLWGGSGLPLPKLTASQRMRDACDYANAAMQFKLICDAHSCDVVLGVHPHRCDLFEKLREKETAAADKQNPFVVGKEGVKENLHLRAMEALELACQLVDEM